MTTKLVSKTKKTKKETLADTIAQAVGAGRELYLESVDFSDPNRPKTCLEVDFPILPLNHLAGPEMASGAAKKPIYTWQKWWARRSSHVFRGLLLAAATKAPDNSSEAAKLVWDSFYGNHQKRGNFRNLKVADIFMGGGCTIVEGLRLGMQMRGVELNPVAWFVVKNEVARVNPATAKTLLDDIESEVKPQVMPYYACDCPRGHKGKWTKKATGEAMGAGFEPLALKPGDRPDYDYEGPEAIYTFWSKHGPCEATECNHRTPIMQSPVFAVKKLTVKCWPDRVCRECGTTFDIERHEARMAPDSLFVVSPDERPYCLMNEEGKYNCPHCGHTYLDEAASCNGQSSSLGKSKNKSVALSLLVHPEWLRGSPGCTVSGEQLGGTVTDSAESTAAWNAERAKSLRLIEVRGELPESIICPDTKEVLFTDARGGTVPKKSTFTCKEATCGLDQDILTSIKKSGHSGPVSAFAIQGYCPECDKHGQPYSGRFFGVPNQSRFNAAHTEWDSRRNTDLEPYWPKSELPFGFMTHHLNGGIPNHGFTHWHKMFNPLQLLLHTQLLKAIKKHISTALGLIALGVWQKYVQHDCMFCFWDDQQDCLAPHFSNNNYHPKQTPVQNNPFTKLGRGNWQSSVTTLMEALEWRQNPWDLVRGDEFADQGVTSKTIKVPIGDSPDVSEPVLNCGSASECPHISTETLDLVVTDPPFGGLLHYSELSDFYYVWIRLLLKDIYPEFFTAEYTPKVLEAVTNKARHADDADEFYQRLLTACWREANRTLKPGGLLAFTFHHSEDEPWVAVLESLFDAGFYLEATYPIRSDETKGDGEFGSKKIEFDIVHVCRKRSEESTEISWARLRRQIMTDVKQLQEILEQHQSAGLQEADLQVIRRGKALEYYSKHYGKVYVEKGRDFTVREALVGINTLLDDERDTDKETPPVNAEPYTRQFLRLFADRDGLPRDQMQKFLRGTGVSPAEFESRGWCKETQKVFHVTSPLELAREWKGQNRSGMARDFDQAMFLVGACYPDSGIRVQDTLDSPNFKPHVATPGILDWLTRHGGNGEIKSAAKLAKQLYERWMAANEPKVKEAQRTFDFAEDA